MPLNYIPRKIKSRLQIYKVAKMNDVNIFYQELNASGKPSINYSIIQRDIEMDNWEMCDSYDVESK